MVNAEKARSSVGISPHLLWRLGCWVVYDWPWQCWKATSKASFILVQFWLGLILDCLNLVCWCILTAFMQNWTHLVILCRYSKFWQNCYISLKLTCKLTLDTGDHHCKISNIFIYRYIDMQISYNYMYTGPYILVIPCAQRPDPYWLNLWAKGTFGKLYLIIDINHTEVGVFCAIDGACGHDVAVSFEEFCHRVSTPLCTIP